ncbi:TPA: 2,3-bisphosphoglycerate-independent phosphoglycerate mutase, partial [Candidatus Micrarchaeota archaeon]|nr:2,3-bisphosphoglycerate-independent phosphoglycerate mutase [Candidatus Micrarchaeota archaeon]
MSCISLYVPNPYKPSWLMGQRRYKRICPSSGSNKPFILCFGLQGMNKVVLFIIDGLGDLPTPKTPLQAAKTPNLDKIAHKGVTGMLAPLGRGVVPGSDTSHLELLGYDPRLFYCGRGPLEALGLGMELEEGDVAFRANFATVEDGKVVDRRAGRIDTESASKLAEGLSMEIEGVKVIFQNSVEHRGALVLRGAGISHMVSGTDAKRGHPLPLSHPFDESGESEKTARVVNTFMQKAMEKLGTSHVNKIREAAGKPPANALLLRGAGSYVEVPTFEERFNVKAACVAGGALYRGVARYLGLDIFMLTGNTGDKHTDLKAKAIAVVKALEDYDLLFLHVKACDNFGHDGDFKGKTKMLERIDKEMISALAKTGADLVITGDHSTPCSRKGHSGHEVPILFYGDNERYD